MSLPETRTPAVLVEETYPQVFKIPPDAQSIIDRTRSLRRPGVWPRGETEQLATLDGRVGEYVLDLTLKVTPAIHGLVDVGWGREGQGDTKGREGEDTTIKLDKVAEAFAAERTSWYGKKYGLNVAVLSEHSDVITVDPNVVDVRDPIDNSGEYEAGHGSINQYFAGGVYIKEDRVWKPKAAYSCNTKSQHIFYSMREKNYEYNPSTGEVEALGIPRRVESVNDPKFRLASYVGKYKYLKPFLNNYERLVQYRNQSEALHTVAGSHQYGDGIATGAISAYIMFGEPVGELAQGLSFTKAADYVVASVDPETGEWEEYEFDVEYYLKNPDSYKEDRVPMLIVASTKRLLRELIHVGFSKNLPAEGFKEESPFKNFTANEGEEMVENKPIIFPWQKRLEFGDQVA